MRSQIRGLCVSGIFAKFPVDLGGEMFFFCSNCSRAAVAGHLIAETEIGNLPFDK
jgi:hypothetical protein